MKIAALVLCLGAALFTASCGQDGGVDKRVAELEKQVAALQAQNRDTRAKLRVSHLPRGSPLDEFFSAPEFWQCTYDSSWTDCSGRCSTAYAKHRKTCEALPLADRQDCFTDADNSVISCMNNCPVQSSPATPPIC